MATVLALSSYVASGHIGLGAIVPALQALGHEVVAVPTIILSSHPGHRHFAGAAVEADLFRRMLEALEANETLDGVGAVITGYMPTLDHVRLSRAATVPLIARGATYLCDPVMGDDPSGLYVDAEVAEAIRDQLLPFAHLLTPNRFELSWLSGIEVAAASDVSRAAAAFDATTVATSVPCGPGELDNVLAGKGQNRAITVPALAAVPHGTGDLMAGLLLGHILAGADVPDALASACAGVRRVAEASVGAAELRLVGNLPSLDPAQAASTHREVSANHSWTLNRTFQE